MKPVGVRPWVAVIGAVLLSCGNGNEPAAVDPEALIDAAIVGEGTRCTKSSECPGNVCYYEYCTSLRDAGLPWMEHELAAALRPYTSAHWARIAEKALGTVDLQDPFTVDRVAGFLGALGDARAVPILRPWLESPSERVRVRTQLALLRLGAGIEFADALIAHSSRAVALDATDAVFALPESPERTRLLAVAARSEDLAERLRDRAPSPSI